MQQCLIFDDLPQKIKQPKPTTGKGSGEKRGRYKTRKIKENKISLYQRLHNIQQELAITYKPELLFRKSETFPDGDFLDSIKEEKEEKKYFIFWRTCYRYANKSELYDDRGVFKCKYYFDEFEINSLELKGTEKLGIKEQVYLHSIFQNFLKKANDMDEAAKLMQPFILQFQRGEVMFNDRQC